MLYEVITTVARGLRQALAVRVRAGKPAQVAALARAYARDRNNFV